MLTPLYTTGEMRRAEEGHDVSEMMARAGRAVAEEALRRFPDASSFGAVCGGGANGGDARIALEVLRAAGRDAEETLEADVLIDGLLGTGFSGELRPEAADLVERMNASWAPTLSVDLPSGVDADTGEVQSVAVRAAATVALHGPKVGNVVAPGRFHGGELVVADIGIGHEETKNRLVAPEILDLVPRKTAQDTKYSAGSVLVVGGSPGMSGAVSLAAEAALRADAGYVAIAAPPASLPSLDLLVVEAVKRPLDEAFDALERAGAVAIGPGLGREPSAGGARGRAACPCCGADGGGRGCAVRARAVRARRDDGAHAARRRARPSPRRDVGVGRRTSARSGAACGRYVRVRLSAQRCGHPRGGTGRRRARLRSRAAFARDGGSR